MRSNLLSVLLLTLLVCAGCNFTANTSTVTSTAKPVNSEPKKDEAAKPKNEKPKSAVRGSEKPEGTAKTAKKNNPVPDDWIYVYDSNKGYGFSVPEGTLGESDSVDGVDYMVLTTPSPSNIDMFVLAYKNRELTKEDLLNDAVAFLEEMGQRVTPGSLQAESDLYAVADATTVLADGSKGRLRIMVGTDITDNYVMILGTADDKFAANENIIDEIWGSFEMWS
ncbi:MAG: hypothetical protein KIS76_13035 [Pyrinomonadaceae bacterium]|nr:hypothetical protein [Pyrinomonadaceae bacterium]